MDKLLFHVPSRIHFGFEALLALGNEASDLGNRALVVMDSVLSGSDVRKRVEELLGKHRVGTVVFDETGSGSTTAEILKGAELARAGKAEMIIGVGGLHALSSARCIAATTSGKTSVYDLLDGLPGETPPLPHIQVLTTCRNHFMLTDNTPVVDARTGKPRILHLPGSKPSAIIIDPLLTLGLSVKYAVATLMETVLVAVEGYLSRKSTFISDSMFLKTIATAVGVLRDLSEHPQERAYRESASQAGLLAALGVSMSSMGAGSALSLSLSGTLNIPKAFTSAILLPYILEYGRSARPDKIARLAPILGEYVENLSPAEAALRVIEAVRHRIGIEGMPTRLGELGVKNNDLPEVVDTAMEFDMNRHLPTPLAREDYLEILKAAL
ncbi:MAG: iron-containing alcohol dehydrogenase [Spirochaetales bacterium]|nr:iron-containing alcohol dehydrogenase [Spirochaetales bacterium]